MSALPSHLDLVQGVVLPKPVGADPVLDFLNTRSDWSGRGPARSEWLTGYETLAIWTGYLGLLPDATVFRLVEQAAGRPVEAERRFRTAVQFRADLYDVLTTPAASSTTPSAVPDSLGSSASFSGVTDSAPSPAVSDSVGAFAGVAGVIEGASARRRLKPLSTLHGVGAMWDLPEGLDLPLDRVALLAADLLTGPSRPDIHRCAGDHCGWLFLDPRGRRRWCSMATCGNRSKVRAHAARTR